MNNFDIGKDLQNAFKDGYNTAINDVIKIIEKYKSESELNLQSLLEKIMDIK